MMIKDRLLRFMAMENLSSTQFADSIGVQRSTVSHLLAGRNNPSYDFIVKILNHYKYLSADWLLNGTGNMYRQKDNSMNDLFSMPAAEAPVAPAPFVQPAPAASNIAQPSQPKEDTAQFTNQVEQKSIDDLLAETDESLAASASNAETNAAQSLPESSSSQPVMQNASPVSMASANKGKAISRIVIFYADHSMEVYE